VHHLRHGNSTGSVQHAGGYRDVPPSLDGALSCEKNKNDHPYSHITKTYPSSCSHQHNEGSPNEDYTRGYADGFLARQPDLARSITRDDLRELRDKLTRVLHGDEVFSVDKQRENQALKEEIEMLKYSIQDYEKQAVAYETLNHRCFDPENSKNLISSVDLILTLTPRHAQLQKEKYLLQTDLDLLKQQQLVLQPSHPGGKPQLSPRLTALTIQSAGGSLALGESIGSQAQAVRMSRLAAQNQALHQELAAERSNHTTPKNTPELRPSGGYVYRHATYPAAPGDAFHLRDY